MTPFELILIVLLLLLSAFLSLSEIALVGISKIRLRHMVERGVPGAQAVQGLVAQMDQVIITILAWASFINAALAGLVTAACIGWLGEPVGVAVAAVISGSLILFVVDILPKVYAARLADTVSLRVAPAMSMLVGLLRPVSRTVTQWAHAVFKMAGISLPSRVPLVTEEELKLMIQMGKDEGVLGEHERMMLHRIFEFGDLRVKDVLVPRDRVVMVQERASHEDVLRILTEQGHSRLPVYRDSPKRITGVLYAQEMLHIWRQGGLIVLQDLLHPPFNVSPDMRVAELLQEFQKRRVQIAIVVDQEGEALGLCTLEDLIEEIVGEIHERP